MKSSSDLRSHIAACCEILDHTFNYLDGEGQMPHLDMLLSLVRLWGIQWIPGDGNPPPEQGLPLLKRIRGPGKLCQLYVSPQGARTIVRELGRTGLCLLYHATDVPGWCEGFASHPVGRRGQDLEFLGDQILAGGFGPR